jgi:ferredoxin hydrogenase
MYLERKTTRREFLKTSVFGAGFLIGCRTNILGFEPLQGRAPRYPIPVAYNNPSIQYHEDRCRFCGRCVDFCRRTTEVYEQVVPSGEDPCIRCGQCTLFCENILTEQYHYEEVARAIADPEKIVIATLAPAVRVALGEMYGLTPGTNVEKEIVGALKQLGVAHVLDATFAADLTVVEEATELIQRLESSHSKGPLFTSCCPAWVRYVSLFYPSLLPNLSTTKSPLLMQGALAKTYFAQKQGIDPEKIVHVALMPCTAKKGEILLEGMNAAGISHGKPEMRDVDFALTCRELASLFKENNVNFLQAQEAGYGTLMGRGSGSALIFGNTGGVMEATLRTACKLLTNENPPAGFFDLHPVRGLDGIRQATIDVGKYKLNVAVVHGIISAKTFIEAMPSGTQKFDFVEVMACSGGCIGGGGQPYTSEEDAAKINQLRLNALYQQDERHTVRLSCDNPEIKQIYSEFLGKPLGEKSKALLHKVE